MGASDGEGRCELQADGEEIPGRLKRVPEGGEVVVGSG